MTEKEGIDKLVRFFIEQESIDESVKEIKDELKASGHDPSILVAVAKALVKNRLDDLIGKSKTTLAMADIARS